MNLYADTSWWIAYKFRADAHHEAATALFFHVAVAIEVAAVAFLSFDEEQNALAKATGLRLARSRGKRRNR